MMSELSARFLVQLPGVVLDVSAKWLSVPTGYGGPEYLHNMHANYPEALGESHSNMRDTQRCIPKIISHIFSMFVLEISSRPIRHSLI